VIAPKTSYRRAPLSRRMLLLTLSLSAIGVGLGLSALPVLAETKGPTEVPVEELMKPGPMGEITLGKPDAKVTIVEYASMTCGHCAHFTKEIWPELKKKYVDSGKAYYIFREFPLDNLAAAASMLARCAGGDKTMPFIEVMFEQQKEWAFGEGNPVPKLFELAKQAGFTQESFDKCLTDQKLLDNITSGRTRAADVFGVNATPTFFINGKKLDGAPTMEAFDKMIGPILGSDAPPPSQAAAPAAPAAPATPAPEGSSK
jgi:protein-disulfide isomerase